MNVYEAVTDRILKKLEEGVIPWRKTWTSGLPKSLTSGKEYRGVNIFLLGMTEFTSRYWTTFLQAKRLGGHIRKGEKGTPVYYWHWRTEEEIEKLRQKTGKENFAPCSLFTSVAFNLDQVEGIERPEDDIPALAQTIEDAESLVSRAPNKPEIRHLPIHRPSYSPISDCVMMPLSNQFESGSEYYSTLFHELVHSTGHPKRLNRFAVDQGNREERYSFEELVAEFGASFLCACAGIANRTTEELSASYIDGWAAAFRKDNGIILRAASAAQQATDYLRGLNGSAAVDEIAA